MNFIGNRKVYRSFQNVNFDEFIEITSHFDYVKFNSECVFFLSVSFCSAIIGIIGYADALKATSLKTFGRNGNKTATAATSTTTTSTTVAASNAEPTSDDDEVSK